LRKRIGDVVKKIRVDKYYLKTVIYAFLLIAAVIVFEKLLGNLEQVSSSFSTFTGFIGGLLTPFIYGFCMAYLANPIVRFIERNIRKLSFARDRKFPRPLSIFLAFVFIALMVTLFILYITPEIGDSVSNISGSVKYYADLLEGQGASITNESIARFFSDIIKMAEEFFTGINGTFGTT
jgi:predicted PurR-regulated permease PerM